MFSGINSAYWFWFFYWGSMFVFIIIIGWRVKPEKEDWKRIIIISLIFVIPYQIFNVLGISIFNLWKNSATSPFPTIFGSPFETIPFSFLGAVLTLLLIRLTRNWKEILIVWIFIAAMCALVALISVILGFMIWVNWNFIASLLFWFGLVGIIVGMDYLFKGHSYDILASSN